MGFQRFNKNLWIVQPKIKTRIPIRKILWLINLGKLARNPKAIRVRPVACAILAR